MGAGGNQSSQQTESLDNVDLWSLHFAQEILLTEGA